MFYSQALSVDSTTDSTIHNRLITTGCLLWCISFFGEGYGAQPYSTVGIMTSPILTITGVFYWLKYYRISRGHYPKFGSVFYSLYFARKNTFAGANFITSHVLEFWTLCILFWMALSSIMFFSFHRSDAFQATKLYCQTSPAIISRTGTITYFAPFVSGSMKTGGDNGEADFSFTIAGAKGNFSAKSKVIQQHGDWMVRNVELQ